MTPDEADQKISELVTESVGVQFPEMGPFVVDAFVLAVCVTDVEGVSTTLEVVKPEQSLYQTLGLLDMAQVSARACVVEADDYE